MLSLGRPCSANNISTLKPKCLKKFFYNNILTVKKTFYNFRFLGHFFWILKMTYTIKKYYLFALPLLLLLRYSLNSELLNILDFNLLNFELAYFFCKLILTGVVLKTKININHRCPPCRHVPE